MLRCVCKYQQIILIGICLSSVKCTQYTLFPPRMKAAKKPTPPMAPPMFIRWLRRGGTGGLGENHPTTQADSGPWSAGRDRWRETSLAMQLGPG